MADNEDTPQIPIEAQQEAVPPKAPEQPPQEKPAQAHPTDAPEVSKPLTGETIEAYSARIAAEMAWRDKQLAKQVRQIRERDERVAKAQEIEAENQRLRDLAQAGTRRPEQEQSREQPASQPQYQPQPQPATMSKDEALFQARVQLLGEQLDRDNKQEAAAAYRNFQQSFGGIDPVIMRAVLASDDPAQAFLALGKDMGQYQQLLEMAPDQRQARVWRLGLKTDVPAAAPRPRPSAAPPPREGLPSGGAVAAVDSEFDPEADCRGPIPAEGETRQDTSKYRKADYDEAWFAKRRQQKMNSQGRPWSYRSGMPKA